MFSFLKPKKYRLEKEEWKEWKEKTLIEVQPEIDLLNKDFSSRYCPIAKTNCLMENCLHFQKHRVLFFNGNNYFEYGPSVDIEKPKCKLWGIEC